MAKSPRKKAPAKRQRAAQPKPKTPPKTQPKPKTRSDRRGTPRGKAAIKGGRGGQIGNPPHEPTPELRKLAETHAAVGTPHWAIAIEMGISADTLERHYRRELDLGLIRMNARIGSNIAKKALAGDAEMEKFWLARRGGPAWANKQAHEHSGPQGKPIEHRDMTGLSEAQLAALAALDDAAEA